MFFVLAFYSSSILFLAAVWFRVFPSIESRVDRIRLEKCVLINVTPRQESNQISQDPIKYFSHPTEIVNIMEIHIVVLCYDIHVVSRHET